MILVTHELISVLRQTIIPTRNLSVEHIRPDLLKYASPAGSLVINVRDSSGYLIKASSSVTISSISASDYFHGVVKFDINVALKSGVTYIIELASSGYAYNSSAFIGWNNDYDLRCNDASFSSNKGISAPLRMEMWERKHVRGS